MAYPTSAYEKIPSENNPREVEAWALMKSARMLQDASKNPEDVRNLQDSIRKNQLLWTIIQTEVANDDNPLPPEIRLNIMNLARLVDQQSFACLGDHDIKKLAILIEINRNMALGLMGKPGGEAEQEAQASKPTLPEAPDPAALAAARHNFEA